MEEQPDKEYKQYTATAFSEPKITTESKSKSDKKSSLPYWWAIIIFGFVLMAYITMYLQEIPVNEYTRAWAIGISGVGASIAAAYQYLE